MLIDSVFVLQGRWRVAAYHYVFDGPDLSYGQWNITKYIPPFLSKIKMKQSNNLLDSLYLFTITTIILLFVVQHLE